MRRTKVRMLSVITAFALSFCLFFSCLPVAGAQAESEGGITEYAMHFYRIDEAKDNPYEITEGFLKDGKYYVPAEDAAKMSGASNSNYQKNGVVAIGYGTRSLSLNPTTSKVGERLSDIWYYEDMPVTQRGRIIYVSISDYLDWLGADWFIEPECPSLVVVTKPTIFNALSLYLDLDNGGQLDFSQMGMSEKEVAKLFEGAGIAMALSRFDVSPIDVITSIIAPGKLIEDDMEKTLLAVLVAGDDDAASRAADVKADIESLGQTGGNTKVLSSVIDKAVTAIQAKQPDGSLLLDTDTDLFLEKLKGGVKGASFALSRAGEILTMLNQVEVYSEITASQLRLLEKGLTDRIKYSSILEAKELQFAKSAIERTREQGGDIIRAAYQEGMSAVLDSFDNIFNDSMPAFGGADSVWSLVKAGTKMIGLGNAFEEQQSQLMHAYCAMIIQEAAAEQAEAAKGIALSSAFKNEGSALETLEWYRSSLLLQLKASLVARQSMVASGKLSNSVCDKMNKTCTKLREVIAALETCKLAGAGVHNGAPTEFDISWVAERMELIAGDWVIDEEKSETGKLSTLLGSSFEAGKAALRFEKNGKYSMTLRKASTESGSYTVRCDELLLRKALYGTESDETETMRLIGDGDDARLRAIRGGAIVYWKKGVSVISNGGTMIKLLPIGWSEKWTGFADISPDINGDGVGDWLYKEGFQAYPTSYIHEVYFFDDSSLLSEMQERVQLDNIPVGGPFTYIECGRLNFPEGVYEKEYLSLSLLNMGSQTRYACVNGVAMGANGTPTSYPEFFVLKDGEGFEYAPLELDYNQMLLKKVNGEWLDDRAIDFGCEFNQDLGRYCFYMDQFNGDWENLIYLRTYFDIEDDKPVVAARYVNEKRLEE